MKWLGKLTRTFVENLRQPGTWTDRNCYGLALRARPTKTKGVAKTWIQRIQIDGKVTNRGLGSYPKVTLDEARRRAQQNWIAIKKGHHPITRNQPTFQEAAERVIKLRLKYWRPGCGTLERWEYNLRTFLYPRIGAKKSGRSAPAT